MGGRLPDCSRGMERGAIPEMNEEIRCPKCGHDIFLRVRFQAARLWRKEAVIATCRTCRAKSRHPCGLIEVQVVEQETDYRWGWYRLHWIT